MAPWASLVGWIGAVFLIFGLLSVLMQLVTSGLFWSRDQLWIWGNFGLGLVLLAAALFTNLDALRERMRSGEARRASKYGTSAVLQTLLGIALIAGLGFLATRNHVRWDFTEALSHSLSDQTRKTLEGLDADVEVTALYTPVSQGRARDLLDRYTYVSDRFHVSYADPQAQPGLVRKLGIDPGKLSGGVTHVQIGNESVEVEELGEESVTNALVKLTRRDRKKVYFLEGHNERPAQGEGSDANDGFAFAAEALTNENYSFETLLLAAKGDVPDDADVVIVAGATRPLHPIEREALHRYMQGGGALLVMIDPRARTNLGEDLAIWGVALGDDVVVDRVQGMFGRPVSPFAAEYAPHPITEGLREAALFHMARSVEPRAEAADQFTVLVRTGDQSWAERGLDAFFAEGRAELDSGDLPGPVAVAVAGKLEFPAADGAAPDEADAEAETPGGHEARLVVFGDSDFATNQLFREFRNRDLFVNAVNWLLGDVEAISIRPTPPRASRLTLSTDQFLQIRALSLFVLPELIAIAGVVAWWSRRRAPGR